MLLPAHRSRVGAMAAFCFNLALWCVVAFILWLVLSGCSITPSRDACATCIGPYDVALRSHREALFGRDMTDAEGLALAEYLRERY